MEVIEGLKGQADKMIALIGQSCLPCYISGHVQPPLRAKCLTKEHSKSAHRPELEGKISTRSTFFLKGPGQPHLCFCLHARIWLLCFIRSLSKRRKITVELFKIIKHTFCNTAYSKTIRIRFTMLYQYFRWHRKWRRLTRVL